MVHILEYDEVTGKLTICTGAVVLECLGIRTQAKKVIDEMLPDYKVLKFIERFSEFKLSSKVCPEHSSAAVAVVESALLCEDADTAAEQIMNPDKAEFLLKGLIKGRDMLRETDTTDDELAAAAVRYFTQIADGVPLSDLEACGELLFEMLVDAGIDESRLEAIIAKVLLKLKEQRSEETL